MTLQDFYFRFYLAGPDALIYFDSGARLTLEKSSILGVSSGGTCFIQWAVNEPETHQPSLLFKAVAADVLVDLFVQVDIEQLDSGYLWLRITGTGPVTITSMFNNQLAQPASDPANHGEYNYNILLV